MRLVALLTVLVSVTLPVVACAESREVRECHYRPSFNCAQADDAMSRLICTTPDLLTVDCAMGYAYRDARALPGDDQERRVRKDQRNWLDQRDTACAKRSGRQLIDCLKTQTERRTRWLIEHHKLPVVGKVYERYGNTK